MLRKYIWAKGKVRTEILKRERFGEDGDGTGADEMKIGKNQTMRTILHHLKFIQRAVRFFKWRIN